MTLATCPDDGAVRPGSGDLRVRTATGEVSAFAALLENPDVDKYGYYLKQQFSLLAEEGIAIQGKLLDISMMHYLINPERSHSLEILARTYAGIELEECGQEEREDEPVSLFD